MWECSCNVPDQGPVEASPGRHAGSPTSPRENGFHSAFVLDRVESQTSNADSYFELNKRQAQLDLLRKEAGLNPHPTIKADLEEFQRRLDDNRRILDERRPISHRDSPGRVGSSRHSRRGDQHCQRCRRASRFSCGVRGHSNWRCCWKNWRPAWPHVTRRRNGSTGCGSSCTIGRGT